MTVQRWDYFCSGGMQPDDTGEFVTFDDYDRLRAELESERAAHEATKAELARLRSVHEMTTESLGESELELKAAEARVAELERELALTRDDHAETELARQIAAAALDQARVLLEQTPMPDPDGEGPTNGQLENWADFIHSMADLLYGSGLRAHPNTATPAATGAGTLAASDGTPVAVHPDFAASHAAAPDLWQGVVDAAATGAERTVGPLAAGPRDADDYDDDEPLYGAADPRAEKEQGT